jgi:hypothetical protein
VQDSALIVERCAPLVAESSREEATFLFSTRTRTYFRQLDTDRDDALSRQEFTRIASVAGTGTPAPGATAPR